MENGDCSEEYRLDEKKIPKIVGDFWESLIRIRLH